MSGVVFNTASNSIDVSWRAATNSSRYTIQWRTSSQSFSTARQGTATQTSYTIPNLQPLTRYYVRVQGHGGSGAAGSWSSERSAWTRALTCETPTNLSGHRYSASNVWLSWTNPSTGLSATGRRIHISKLVNGQWTYERQITEPAGSTSAYHLGMDNSWFSYAVRSECSGSNSPWSSWANIAPYSARSSENPAPGPKPTPAPESSPPVSVPEVPPIPEQE